MTNNNNNNQDQAQPIAPTKNAITLFIIDQSGSMEPLKAATQESHSAVITKIKQESIEMPTLQQYTNTWTFGNQQVLEQQPLTKVVASEFYPELVLNCNGSTPLFDAMGRACSDLEMRLQNLGFSPENTLVTVAVFTDGEENSSRTYTQAEVKRLVTRLKTKGWVFNYYGTDVSVEEMKERLAFDDGMMMAKTPTSFKMGMHDFSAKSTILKSDWIKMDKEDFEH